MKKIKPSGELFYCSLKKILKIMRITFLLMILGILSAHATDSYSQSTRLSLNFSDTEVNKVLEKIEEGSEFYFLYNQKLLDTGRKVNIKANNQLITDILDDLFEGTDVKYNIIDRKIILAPSYLLNGTDSPAIFQQQVITGTVIDSQTGEAMPGVNIQVKGTVLGTTTDVNGKYSLSVPSQEGSLVFSFIGYNSKEVLITGKSVIDIALLPELQSLDDVVVIGYGTQRKVTLTGSVTAVKPQDVQSSPSITVSNALAGLIPGLTTLNRSGEPGKDVATLIIRGRSTTGNSEPLIVVDGIQGYIGWERINSNDIESISVLKDAAATIYGARAANGVILINTKRGALGKPIINYTLNQAIVRPTRLPRLASSAVYADYINDLLVRQGGQPIYTEDDIKKFADGSDPVNYANTDWGKESLKPFSLQNQQSISVRGGSENVKYSVSGSMSNADGIIKGTSHNYKTYSVRSNIDANINKYLKVGFDLNYALQNGNYPRSSYSAFRSLPFYPVYWPNGLPSNPPSTAGNHPIVLASSVGGNNNEKKQQNNIKASFDIIVPWIKGLGIDGYLYYSNSSFNKKEWLKPFYLYDYDKTTDTYIPQLKGSMKAPELTQQMSQTTNSLLNFRIKYEKILNIHRFSTFIAVEQSEDNYTFFSAKRINFLSSSLDELFAGSLVDQSTNGSSSQTGRQNIFGRFSYGLKDRYLLDINVRYDGSSNFPKGNRWGLFHGISAAWRISEEQFFDKLDFIDDMKIRVSTGKIGNDAVAAYQYLSLYYLGSTGYSFGVPATTQQGLVAGVSPNPNITWESATTSNIGMDATFYNGLFGFEVDLFKQKRSNILAPRELSIPFYTYLILPDENVGVVENKGVELKLTSQKTFGEFLVRMAGNFSYAKSKIINISEADNVPEWQKAEGRPLGSEKYFLNNGIIRTQAELDAAPKYGGTIVGDLQYKDIDGDGKITTNDMVRLLKSNIPEITFGFNLLLNYKNISLWANFAGQARAWQYYHLNSRVGQNGFAEIVENRYRVGSMDSKYPWIPTQSWGPGISGEVSGIPSDFWFKNASFLRLKTLELSYTLPNNLVKV
jgi:TonB-linked SusC/RagA family outer membrane protein